MPKTNFPQGITVESGAAVTAALGDYKIARGVTALDASNPTPVATGLASVISFTATLVKTSTLGSGTAFVTHGTITGGSVDVYGWVAAGTASTGTESFSWVAVGT